jgi:hypothetical protein
MGLRERIEAGSSLLGEKARQAAASAPVQRRTEELRSLHALLTDDGQSLSVERFLTVLVGAVRDEEGKERAARDIYVAARKRRRRLGLMAFGAGPFVGVANQFADLYCETAVVCDVAALHGVSLSSEEIGAHLLVLWRIVETPEDARRSMAGDPPVATILARKLRDRLGEQLPEKLTKTSIVKALWDARAALDDVRKGSASNKGAVRTVVFTGHRTKKLIKKTEAQLGVT